MIQTVILAGGLGTRMRPHTERVPKPMLPVLGRPFIEHQVELLRDNGMHRFLLLVGYLGEQIEAYLGDGSRYGVEIDYSYEPTPLGTGGALKNAAGKLDHEFMVVNGDTLLEMDYAGLLRRFRESGKSLVIAATRNAPDQPGNLLVSGEGVVLDYSKRRLPGAHTDAGVAVVGRRALELLPDGRSCSFEEEVIPVLSAKGEALAFTTDRVFFDMGTPAGLAALEAHLA